MTTTAVFDTSVLLDMSMASRPRYSVASKLAHLNLAGQLGVVAPFHALFELSAGIKQQKQAGSVAFSSEATWQRAFKFNFVPVDQAFFDRYFTLEVPYLPAGDLLFLLLARGENLPLVTEDVRQSERAADAGVVTFNASSFLQAFFPDTP